MNTTILLPWTAESRPPWLARVVGVDREYGWNREWIMPGAGRPGGAVPFVAPSPGLYEAETHNGGNDHRFFFACVDGQVNAVSVDEWYRALSGVYTGYPFFAIENVMGAYWLDGRYGVSDALVINNTPWVVLVVMERRTLNKRIHTLVIAAPRQQPTHGK